MAKLTQMQDAELYLFLTLPLIAQMPSLLQPFGNGSEHGSVPSSPL